jgi:hypothetical protein
MFILGFTLIPYVLKVSSWSLKFQKFELVNPYLIIFIGLTNSNFRNINDQIETLKNLRDQFETFKT